MPYLSVEKALTLLATGKSTLTPLEDLVVERDMVIGGNSYLAVRNLIINEGATLVLADNALIHVFGTVVNKGKVLIMDNAQLKVTPI